MVPDVHLKKENKCLMLQEKFLSNTFNKKQLIDMLATSLEENSNTVVRATADADALIVRTAIGLCKKNDNKDVVIVAEDTDVLVLLVQLCYLEKIIQRGARLEQLNITTKIHLCFQLLYLLYVFFTQ